MSASSECRRHLRCIPDSSGEGWSDPVPFLCGTPYVKCWECSSSSPIGTPLPRTLSVPSHTKGPMGALTGVTEGARVPSLPEAPGTAWLACWMLPSFKELPSQMGPADDVPRGLCLSHGHTGPRIGLVPSQPPSPPSVAFQFLGDSGAW